MGLILAWRSSRQKYEAEIGGGPEEGTSITMGEWTVRSRRRPILSDPDKEAMAARIASFWERKGKAMEGRWAMPAMTTCLTEMLKSLYTKISQGCSIEQRSRMRVTASHACPLATAQARPRLPTPSHRCRRSCSGTASSRSTTSPARSHYASTRSEVGHTQPVDITSVATLTSLVWHHDHTEWVSLKLYLLLVGQAFCTGPVASWTRTWR